MFKFASAAALAATAVASDYTICGDDVWGVTSANWPASVAVGADFTMDIAGHSDDGIPPGQGLASIMSMGTVVSREELIVCDDLDLSCGQSTVGDWKASVPFSIPSNATAASNVQIRWQANPKESTTTFYTCVSGEFEITDASLTDAELMDQGEWYFTKHVQQYSLEFASAADFEHAKDNFVANHVKVVRHNEEGHSWKMGHNQFSHLSFEEFRVRVGLNKPMPAKPDFPVATKHDNVDASSLPSAVDWVSAGAVTGVKDQGQCGSCWSFSTTGGMEGAVQIATGTLTSFSEQMLVSCDTTDSGCSGGLMTSAFDWIENNGGLCTEADYPYTSSSGRSGTCQTTCTPAGTVTGNSNVSPTQSALQSAVVQQPISIAIEADQSAFQLYSSGVMTGTCGTSLDHGVLLTGYGTLDGDDYWAVKNSWGDSWGQAGYILLGRGSQYNGDDGQCGLTMMASYPSA